MIELNKKTQQDFLNREWVQRLLDAGVNMSDAKYCIMKDKLQDRYYIALDKDIKGDYAEVLCMWDRIMPTYTVSELLYKLHEYLCKFAPICGSIDILRYTSFACSVDEDNCHEIIFPSSGPQSYIEQLASLLIQCHKKDIGIKVKDTGDISDK